MVDELRDPLLYRAVNSLSEKAEKLEQGVVTAAFVDMGHLARISTPTTQYIEGRRGTGKTHLLMFAVADVNGRILDDACAAIYLDVRDLRAESGDAEHGDPRATARRIYRDIIAGVLQEVREIDSKLLWHNDVPTERHPYDLLTARQSQDALRRLERAMRGTPQQTGIAKVEETASTATRLSELREIRIGIDGGIDGIAPWLQTAAGAEQGKETGSSGIRVGELKAIAGGPRPWFDMVACTTASCTSSFLA